MINKLCLVFCTGFCALPCEKDAELNGGHARSTASQQRCPSLPQHHASQGLQQAGNAWRTYLQVPPLTPTWPMGTSSSSKIRLRWLKSNVCNQKLVLKVWPGRQWVTKVRWTSMESSAFHSPGGGKTRALSKPGDRLPVLISECDGTLLCHCTQWPEKAVLQKQPTKMLWFSCMCLFLFCSR